MVMAVATMHDQGYAYLSPLTWEQNGLKYCEAHGYPFAVMDSDYGMPPGFAKIDGLLAICNRNPEVEWILWKDCDSLITNFSIRIEDVVDNDYHVMLTTYWNGINAGMLMVRNTAQGRGWLSMIMSKMPEYINDNWKEQQVMIDTLEEYKDIVKIVPQRTFNAACFSDGCHTDADSQLDKLGTSGQWQPGDWIMHWPGQHPQLRVNLALKYMAQVIPANPS